MWVAGLSTTFEQAAEVMSESDILASVHAKGLAIPDDAPAHEHMAILRDAQIEIRERYGLSQRGGRTDEEEEDDEMLT